MGFAERAAERRKKRAAGGGVTTSEQTVITPEQAAELAKYGVTVQPTTAPTAMSPTPETGGQTMIEQGIDYGQRVIQGAKAEYGISQKNMRRSDIGYKLLTGTATPEDKQEEQALRFQIENESKLNEGAPMIGTAPASVLPQVGRSLVEGARGGLFGASAGAVAGAVTGPGAAAGAGIGAGVGATVQALGDMRKQEAGQAYLSLRDAGVHDDIAKPAAEAYGLGSMILEQKALKLLTHLLPGGDKLAKGVMSTALGKVIQKAQTPAAKAATRLTGVAVGEATVETTQQFLQNVIQEIAAEVDNVKYKSGLGAKSASQLQTVLTDGLMETFAKTALGFGITAIPGTSVNLLVDTKIGRAAAKAAKEEAPDTPVEVTIKKKAETKRLRERAAVEREERKLAEKKKAEKKQEPAPKPVPPVKLPTAPVVDPNADAPGPEGVGTTPSYPPRTAPPAGMPDLGAIQAQGPAPAAPVAPQMPKAPVAPTGTPDLGALQAGTPEGPTPTSPSFQGIVDKYGTEIKTAPGFEFITDLSKKDVKGLQQKKLTQPILILQDGTIVKGPELSEPWSISKNKVALEELPDSYSEARKEAYTKGLDLQGAKPGFLVDGKPVESAVIKEKFDIGNQERMARGEMDIEQQAQKDEAAAIEGLTKERERWAEKVRKSREPTDVDLKAARKLRSAALRAAKKVRDTKLGKHFDVSDLQGAAQEAMWMVMLNDSPAKVEGFMKGERGYYNRMVAAVTNHLLNWQKEQLGPRRKVAEQLKKGTLKSPVQYQEWTQGEEPTQLDQPLYPDLESNAVENRTVQQSSGIKANPRNVGVRLQDTLPSQVVRINPKTGERTTVSIAEMKGELLKRRAEIKKETAAKKAKYAETAAAPISKMAKRVSESSQKQIDALAARELEAINKQLANLPEKTKPAMPSTDLGKIAAAGVSAKAKKTPSEKLAKKAKPAKKARKRAEGKDYKLEIDTRTLDTKNFDKLYDNSGTRAPKNNMGYANTTGARLAAHKLNKVDGEGTWEVYPHPYSAGNYTIVNQKMLDKVKAGTLALKTQSDLFKESVTGQPKPVETTVTLEDNKVPSAGSIFDQTRKLANKIDEAIENDYAAKDAKLKKDSPDLGALMTEQAVNNNPVNVADKFKKHIKAKGEGTIDLGSLMNNEKGSSGMMQDLLNIIYGGTKKVFKGASDLFDVQAKWDRIKAHNTGLRLKNFHGAVNAVEKAELKRLEQFANIVKESAKDISQEDLARTALAAEDPALLKTLPDNHKTIAQWIRNYFDASEQEYLDRNIEISFQTRKMMDLMDTVEETKSWDARNKALHDMNVLDRLEFVHIPLKVLKESIGKTKGKEFQAKFAKKVRSLENLAARKRRALSLNDLVNKKIVPVESIDVFKLLGNYMRNKANDMAVADIRDAALNDGLLKAQKSRPKADANGTWKKVPPKFRGLGMFGKDNVWIHDSIINALTDTLEAYQVTSKWDRTVTKTFNIVKMAQFYNPVFLPMYDLVQHVMLGAVTPTSIFSAPGNLAKAAKQVWNNDDAYLEALSEGLASTPFGVTFDEYMADVETISKGHRSLGQTMMQTLAKSIPQKGNLLGPLSVLYQGSWKMAWKMDNMVRMASYNFLREKEGMNASDAAQVAAKFHGDYASVPTKLRQRLNRFLFTPTFKIAMMKLYGEMLTNVMKAAVGKGSNMSTAQKRMAWGALTTAMVLVGQEYVMRSVLGFDEDKFGRRYKKKKFTAEGPVEWVISISTPANVPHRLLHKFLSFTDPASTNPLTTWGNNIKWELHPMIRLMIDLGTNTGDGNQAIFGSMDDPEDKLIKSMLYVSKSVAPVLPALVGADSGFSTPEGKEMIAKELGQVFGWLMNNFVSSYTRRPDMVRKGYRINKLHNDMVKEMKSGIRNGRDIPMKKWIENFGKRVKQILKEK